MKDYLIFVNFTNINTEDEMTILIILNVIFTDNLFKHRFLRSEKFGLPFLHFENLLDISGRNFNDIYICVMVLINEVFRQLPSQTLHNIRKHILRLHE